MVRLILFDIDGTLIHTAGAGVRAFASAFDQEFNIPSGTERINFSGRTDTSLVREFFEMNGVETSELNFQRFFHAYLRCLESGMRECQGNVCAGMVRFLSDLKSLPQPPTIGLLTGNIQRGAQIKLSRFGLWDHFAFGGFADDSEDRNHIAAAAYERGCARLNRKLDGNEVVVVGDTPLDIRCGRAIGAKVLAVATGTFTQEALVPHGADWTVADMTQVTAREVIGFE